MSLSHAKIIPHSLHTRSNCTFIKYSQPCEFGAFSARDRGNGPARLRHSEVWGLSRSGTTFKKLIGEAFS